MYLTPVDQHLYSKVQYSTVLYNGKNKKINVSKAWWQVTYSPERDQHVLLGVEGQVSKKWLVLYKAGARQHLASSPAAITASTLKSISQNKCKYLVEILCCGNID